MKLPRYLDDLDRNVHAVQDLSARLTALEPKKAKPMPRVNSAGVALIQRFEQKRLSAYMPTPNDVPTIGWGHTGRVKMGDTCDDEQADKWLFGEDIPRAEKIVTDAVLVHLNANQFSALVSFVLNVGYGKEGVKDGFVQLKNGRSSTMLQRLNAGDYEGAAAEFPKWNHQAWVELAGLTRRRQSEEDLFRKPVKALINSRTMQAQTVAGAGTAVGLASQIYEVRDTLSTVAYEWRWAGIAVTVLTLAAIGITLWVRYTGHKEGLQ